MVWNCVQKYINKRKIANWKKRSKISSDWETSITEKVHIGLWCHRRRKEEEDEDEEEEEREATCSVLSDVSS